MKLGRKSGFSAFLNVTARRLSDLFNVDFERATLL
jgi:hypothetical protein